MPSGVYKRTLEHRKKLSLAGLGRFQHLHSSWKGENVCYQAIHIWLRQKYGKASKCENSDCKFENPSRYEWASIVECPKRRKEDFKQLCPSCHRRLDYGNLVL